MFPGIPSKYTVDYSFTNHGRTPAIVTNAIINVNYIESGFPNIESIQGGILPSVMILSGGQKKEKNKVKFDLTPEIRERAVNRDGRIFFWGRIKYLDVFDRSHETAICAEWNFGESRFVVSKYKELNYHT
jgi:hypothetical protein